MKIIVCEKVLAFVLKEPEADNPAEDYRRVWEDIGDGSELVCNDLHVLLMNRRLYRVDEQQLEMVYLYWEVPEGPQTWYVEHRLWDDGEAAKWLCYVSDSEEGALTIARRICKVSLAQDEDDRLQLRIRSGGKTYYTQDSKAVWEDN